MKQGRHIDLGRRLLDYQERPENSLAESIAYNETSVYVSEERFRLEQEVLFRKIPLVIGFSCEMAEVGDFLTDDNTGVPILVVRGEDGRLKAFLNSCRHRGAAIAEQRCGKGRKHFACPYHGWVYGTDGSLVSIPDQGFGFEGVAREKLGLIALPVAERDGLIWVLPDPEGSLDLPAFLAGLDDELGAIGFGNYAHFQTVSLRPPLNWKLVSEGFWEGYHLKVLHRKTIEPIFLPKATAFDAFGKHHRMTIARRTLAELKAQPESEWDLLPHTAMVYNFFPNTIFVLQGDHVEITRVFPGTKVDECVVHFSLFTPEPCRSKSARGHWQRNMDLLLATVEQEDFRVAGAIQRAASSRLQPYQVIGRYEPALAHFHRTIRLALGEPAEVIPTPANGG